jgi:DNA-binding CsgD family transcriptional regulator
MRDTKSPKIEGAEDTMNDYASEVTAKEFLRLVAGYDVLLQENKGGDCRDPARTRRATLQYYRHRLLILDRGLTARELDVAVRALYGLTAEGTALDLAIKTSSVITYRKRAYERLGISSLNELFRMVA